jgi:hypothetical protein
MSVQGISLTIEQYSALINVLPQLEHEIQEKGESVPRPDYSGAAPVPPPKENQQENSDEDTDDVKKANFEATSEEED